MKKRLLSLLLVSVMMMGFITISPSAAAEEILCDITINIVGSGTVTYENNGVSDSIGRKSTVSYSKGSEVVLTATPAEGSEFIYWVNSETERAISFDPVYTTTAATYMNLEAVFSSVTDGYHHVSYLTLMGGILKSGSFKVGRVVIAPEAPVLDGFVFSKWKYSLTDISSTSENLFVYPVYDIERSDCRIDITKYGETTTQMHERFSVVTVSADGSYDGKHFQYWRETNEKTGETSIVSYYSTYSFYAVYDTHLEAVYSSNKVTAQPVTRLIGDSPDFENGRISFYEEYNVPKDYTVVQHGIILTSNPSLANSENGSRFIIGATGVAKGTSKDNTYAGLYSLTLTNWPKEGQANGEPVTAWPIIYARSYLIVKDENGTLLDTIYSPVYTADYFNYGYTGDMDDNNYDDPFA